jgi:putative PIG3 family NAD(P)H quinone oxidoreductase
MTAITIAKHGTPEVLTPADLPKPTPGPEELLVRVQAAGVNRADCLQRQGNYKVPPGVGDLVPGLEIAGVVEAVGPGVGSAGGGFARGDRVFGLVAEGAYAEYAVIDSGLAMRIPEGWDYVTAAAVTEVFCTANETIFELGGLGAGESILIHAGASGVGSTGVQMAKAVGATVYFTVGSREKREKVLALGGDQGILYKETDFAEEILRLTDGAGVDQVEDFIGAAYLSRNLAVLKTQGRLVQVGLMGGTKAEIDLPVLMRKRLTVRGFQLRPQSIPEKRGIVDRVRRRWLPLLVRDRIKPIIYATLPLEQAAEAHKMMEANENFGKIVLTVG